MYSRICILIPVKSLPLHNLCHYYILRLSRGFNTLLTFLSILVNSFFFIKGSSVVVVFVCRETRGVSTTALFHPQLTAMLSFLRFCLFYLLYIYYASSFSISLLTSVLSVLLNCSNNLFYIIFSYSTSTSNTSCSTCSIFVNFTYVLFYINFYINSCSTCSTFEFDITLICSSSTSLLTACSVCSILPAFLHLFSSVLFVLHELLMLLTVLCSLLFYLWLPRTPRYRT